MATTKEQALANVFFRETARDVLSHRRVLATPGETPGEKRREKRDHRVPGAGSEIHYRRDWHLRIWHRDKRAGERRQRVS